MESGRIRGESGGPRSPNRCTVCFSCVFHGFVLVCNHRTLRSLVNTRWFWIAVFIASERIPTMLSTENLLRRDVLLLVSSSLGKRLFSDPIRSLDFFLFLQLLLLLLLIYFLFSGCPLDGNSSAKIRVRLLQANQSTILILSSVAKTTGRTSD